MSNLETIKHMIIRTARRVDVDHLAQEKGVDVAFRGVDWDTVLRIWGYDGRTSPTVDTIRRAKAAAAAYTLVVFRADRPGDLLAVASHEDGAPTFTKVPGADFEWTPEAMDAIDFHRCDRCGVRHDRVKVYLIRNRASVDAGDPLKPHQFNAPDILQYGGQCAKSAAERLRAQLAFLNQVARLAGDWDAGDFYGGSAKWSDPTTLLVLAEAAIRLHGYTKSSESGSTKFTVAAWLDRLPPDVADAIAQVDQEALLADVDAWLETLDDSEDFGRNMRVALETGSRRLLGFLVYAPMGVRRMKEDQAKAKARAQTFPYDPAGDTLLARLETFSAEELKLSKRDAAKVFSGLEPSKGGAAKLAKCLAGTWTVVAARPLDGWYGLTTFVTFQRADGARLTWKASGRPEADVGASYRLRGTVVDELRRSEKWGDERRIQRVSMF